MVDGVLLLVDASEGPLPQTRFVLRKALEQRLPVVLVVNKVDRPDARVEEVVNEVYELFLDLDATEEQIEFPIVYTVARDGRPGSTRRARRRPDAALRDAARDDPAAVLRPRASAAGARHEPRRVARTSAASRCCASATARSARASRSPGAARTARSRTRASPSCSSREALDRVPADEAGPGEIVALAGLPEVTIGETIADPDDPRPLPVTVVDEPSLSITIGINTSPLAGTEGDTADREPGQAAARPGARRQRLAARPPHAAPGHVGGAGPRRAPARGARGDHAPRGLRADDRQARGARPRDRRQAARAGRAGRDRRARGLRRRRHAAARAAQGPDAADGQPRHRLGAHGVPRAGARPDRLPHRVPDRDARRGDHAPRLRALGAVVRRAAHAPDRQPRRRPPRRRQPASRSRTSRSAARSSSRRPTSCTRA